MASTQISPYRTTARVVPTFHHPAFLHVMLSRYLRTERPQPCDREGRPYISLAQHSYMKCRDTPCGCPVYISLAQHPYMKCRATPRGCPIAGVLSRVSCGGCPVHVCLTFDHLVNALTPNTLPQLHLSCPLQI